MVSHRAAEPGLLCRPALQPVAMVDHVCTVEEATLKSLLADEEQAAFLQRFSPILLIDYKNIYYPILEFRLLFHCRISLFMAGRCTVNIAAHWGNQFL